MTYTLTTIHLDKLRKHMQLNPDKGFTWNENEFINLNDITKGLLQKLQAEHEPYGDNIHYIVMQQRTKEWHIRRVIYYIERPYEIKDIHIKHQYSNDQHIPTTKIIDGNHRLLAAFWLGMECVTAYYQGTNDILDYLSKYA